MLEIMQRLYSKPISVQEALVPVNSQKEFWHCTVLNEHSFPISGGFGEDQIIARKIAIAEFLERINYQKIAADKDNAKKWGLDIIPTGCGFAVGYHRENTILRSVGEALERWVLSKWIDDDLYIDELQRKDVEQTLDPASLFFVNNFENILYFKKTLLVPLSGNFVKFNFGITVCLKDKGIYIGSSAKIEGENLWQHALLESFRHLLAYRNNPKKENVFPSNRINYFAENAEIGLEQIRRAKKDQWPSPNIIFHHLEKIEDGDYFFARTIVDGWKAWNLGPLERFLY